MTVKVKCIHCGEMASEFATECPSCGKPVANKDAPTNIGDEPWKKRKTSYGKKSPVIPIIIAIVIIAAAAAVYFLKFK